MDENRPASVLRFVEKGGRDEDPALAGFHAAARERLALVWTLGAERTGPPPITTESKRVRDAGRG